MNYTKQRTWIQGNITSGIHRSKGENDKYLGSGKRFRKAVSLYGPSKFKRDVLCVFESRLEATRREHELIMAALPDPLCYNEPPRRPKAICPIPVKRVLKEWGQDIRNARLRRRIQTAILAERCSISRTTLVKVEQGLPGVTLGLFATVLFSLGLLSKFSSVIDAREDEVGLALQEESLPKRIRHRVSS